MYLLISPIETCCVFTKRAQTQIELNHLLQTIRISTRFNQFEMIHFTIYPI